LAAPADGTVLLVSRLCAKPGCDRPSTATLSYAESTVWLEDLAAEAHPMVHDLCDVHADTVRVPRGWELRDQRSLAAGPSSLDLIGA
jgi:hypothetical protein